MLVFDCCVCVCVCVCERESILQSNGANFHSHLPPTNLLFKVLDTGGDGRISRKQYLSGFDILDENKDGANFCFSIICFYLLKSQVRNFEI
jgi:hypothetical protein